MSNFYIQNSITRTVQLDILQHKENKGVYGFLIDTNKGMVFHQTKWIWDKKEKKGYEIDKPKFIKGDIYQSFKSITKDEYNTIWGTELEKL